MRSDPGDGVARSEDETQLAPAINEVRGDVHGPSVQARDIHGGVHVTVAPASVAQPVPAQLPPGHGIFIGRDTELAALDDITAGSDGHALIVISGMGGSGKTALAGHWAHRVRDRYPDGILYADLRGHEPDHAADPGAVLISFLLALGARPESIPLALDEQAKLFRTLTAGRRILPCWTTRPRRLRSECYCRDRPRCEAPFW